DIYKETGVYEALKVAKQLKNTQNDLTKEKKVYTLGTNGVQSLMYYIYKHKTESLQATSESYSFQSSLYNVLKRLPLLNRINQQTFREPNTIIDKILEVYKSEKGSSYNAVKKSLDSGNIKKVEDAKAYLKLLISNEMLILSKAFKGLFKENANDDLRHIYFYANKYVLKQKEIDIEYQNLKAKGHVKQDASQPG
ncbi:MAG: hypothetical protein U9N32_00275, partial [Spirochaetota bacterium]|nr:hypothetical protein [Spirochaetota bacterium]